MVWYNDSKLGRWTSPDSIIPDLANPQSLNRLAYVPGNPLRFRDPSGYYSEDEIIEPFEADTWDEVLAFFSEGGELEGVLAEYSHPLRSSGIRRSLIRAALVIVMQTAEHGAKDKPFTLRYLSYLHRLACDSLSNALLRGTQACLQKKLQGGMAAALEGHPPPY
jgi:hypothetical protein